MKYFIDWEFIEDGKTIDPISVGVVREDGKTFYAVNKECDFTKASDWVKKNVLSPMGVDFLPNNTIRIAESVEKDRKTKAEIRAGLLNLTKWDTDIRFIGYYADYDWVTTAQLFGTMVGLPKEFPMFCYDVKQWLMDLGNPTIPLDYTSDSHHALIDAMNIKSVYYWLRMLIKQGHLAEHPGLFR